MLVILNRMIQLIGIFVFLYELVDIFIIYLIYIAYQLSNTITGHIVSHLLLGSYLITFCYRNITHIVTKTCNFCALAVVPGTGSSCPDCQFVNDRLILPVANNHFPVLP